MRKLTNKEISGFIYAEIIVFISCLCTRKMVDVGFWEMFGWLTICVVAVGAAVMLFKKRPKNVIAVIIIIGFLINALNWGMCFEHMGGFQFSITYTFKDFVTENDAYIRIGDGHYPSFDIPFVFWVYPLERPPYDFYISINDRTNSLAKMVLETVHVDYGDGDNRKFELHLDKEFVSSEYGVTQNAKTIYTPSMRLDEKLPAIVEESKSCTIKLIGFFIDSTGNKMPFETEDYFEYKRTYWRMYPMAGSF
jgi:hypothetical protein